jgi:hypothetical protein
MNKYVKYMFISNVFVVFFCGYPARALEDDLSENYAPGTSIF